MLSFKEYLSEEFNKSKVIPKKTIKAYKLFKIKKNSPNKLFPLYVDANKPIQIGKWLDAEVGELTDKGKVKSKLGPLAYRPGWHSGDVPVATHIGLTDSVGGKPKYRANDQVWAEVEIPADVDWQEEANKRAKKNKDGKIVTNTAHITDQIPSNGFYRYKTNPNMSGNWIISGAMKVNKILTDEEVEQINNSNGVEDLPRKQPLDLNKFWKN
jgi:hypothetical protein